MSSSLPAQFESSLQQAPGAAEAGKVLLEQLLQQRLGHRVGDPAVPASLCSPCVKSGIMPGCILCMRDFVTAADF